MTTFIAVQVDAENNATAFWDAIGERYPSLAKALRRDGHAVIAESLWDELATLPGFEDGPDYAPTALIDRGSEGDVWANVVASRHAVFESLS